MELNSCSCLRFTNRYPAPQLNFNISTFDDKTFQCQIPISDDKDSKHLLMVREGISFTMFILAIKTSAKEKRNFFNTTVNIPIAFTFLISFQASGCSVVLLACFLVGGASLVSWAGRAGCFVLLFGPWCRSDHSQNFMTGCTVPPGLPRLRLVTWAGGGAGRRGARFALFSV